MEIINVINKLSKDELAIELKKKNIYDSKFNKDGINISDFSVIDQSAVKLIRNNQTGLIWHRSGSEKILDQKAALKWIRKLNDDGYGGYKDWRLPTAEEALSLINKSVKNENNSYINGLFLDDIDVFWTIDKSVIKDKIWVMLIDQKTVREYSIKDLAFVRPVCGVEILEFSEVERSARKIYKNEQGYWEAEFDYDIKMIHIPAGEFIMGDNELNEENDDCPEHRVFLNGYWIGKYPVTFEQYDVFYKDTGRKLPKDEGWGRARRPVINIDWQQSVDYCNWLSEKLELGIRLPTEAAWEKAAKGTGPNKYPWGNIEPDSDIANYNLQVNISTPVGQYSRGVSPYGCLDMSGNVWELCKDWYGRNYYENSPSKNPEGPDNGTERVRRGGSWDCSANYLQSSFRYNVFPSSSLDVLGFRLIF